MKKKLYCEICAETFILPKKELVVHLKRHFEEAIQDADWVESELNILGIKNPYEE